LRRFSVKMENQNKRTPQAAEFDISEVFIKIGQGFKNAGYAFMYSLAVSRAAFIQNRRLFAIVISLGLAFGVLYYFFARKTYYKSTMVLNCAFFNNQLLENTIEKLNLLTKEEGREGLASILNIDTQTAQNIHGFDFEPFVSEDDLIEMEILKEQLSNATDDKKDVVSKVLAKLKIENRRTYEISVLVYNPEIVKPLENAIVNYFLSNEYIKRRLEISSINLKNRKLKLLRESSKLDSLKFVLFQNYQAMSKTSRGSNNVILGDEQMTNPLDVFSQDLLINREILDIDEALYVRSSLEVVDGFTTFKVPESFGLGTVLVIALLTSFVFGYLILGLLKLNETLAQYG